MKNTILNGDCKEMLKQVPSESIDMERQSGLVETHSVTTKARRLPARKAGYGRTGASTKACTLTKRK